MDKKVLHHFWDTATFIDSTHIQFKFKNEYYQFTPKEVADALYFPRDTRISSYAKDVVKSQFEAIGFLGEFWSTIKKSSLSPKWRVIAEVLLRFFSSKTSGWNEISRVMQQMMFGLINGYNFDYAGYVFKALKKQLTFNVSHPAEASSLYPQFITLIIQHVMGPTYPKVRPSRVFEVERLKKHFFLLMIKKDLLAQPVDPPLTDYMVGLLQQKAQVRSSSSSLPSSSSDPSHSSAPTKSARGAEIEPSQPIDTQTKQPTPQSSPPKRKSPPKHITHHTPIASAATQSISSTESTALIRS